MARRRKMGPRVPTPSIKMAGNAAKPAFAKKVKKPEADDLPGKMRAADHMPKQGAKAVARKSLMKRLGNTKL